MSERLLTDRDVAAKLSVSKTTVWKLASKKTLPQPVRFDNYTRWIDSELDAWIAARAAERPMSTESGDRA